MAGLTPPVPLVTFPTQMPALGRFDVRGHPCRGRDSVRSPDEAGRFSTTRSDHSLTSDNTPAIDAIRPAIIAPDAGFQGVLAATVTAEDDFDRDPRVAFISYSDFGSAGSAEPARVRSR